MKRKWKEPLLPTMPSLKGSVCLVLPSIKEYEKIVNALADAQTFTGINYPKVLNKSILIKN